MTVLERKALDHHYYTMKLGNLEDYENPIFYKKKKEFFEKRNGLSNDPAVLKLLENGYQNFVLKTAKRIERESPNEYKINRCSNCHFIARTPYANQCRKCKNNWHDEVNGLKNGQILECDTF